MHTDKTGRTANFLPLLSVFIRVHLWLNKGLK